MIEHRDRAALFVPTESETVPDQEKAKAPKRVNLTCVVSAEIADQVRSMTESGCVSGIRYDEWLEKDMIPVPIGPRVQRFTTAASSSVTEKSCASISIFLF